MATNTICKIHIKSLGTVNKEIMQHLWTIQISQAVLYRAGMMEAPGPVETACTALLQNSNAQKVA